MELFQQSAQQLHDLLISKQASAVEVTKSVIARTEAVESQVQAYITQLHDTALAQAEAVDAKLQSGGDIGVLDGIPFAIKDNICTAGVRTTCASKMLENYIPPFSADVLERLGGHAIMMGKVNMDEFAMGSSTENSFFYPTRNPWDLSAVPGGSSGGSAAAVAAGEAVWALGSDTGGSIRQPASYCGVVGLKPTYGRVSRYGAVAFASSLDQIGPITRNVTDCAHVLNAIAGYDAKDSTSINTAVPDFTKALSADVKGLKIGVPREYFGEGMDSRVAQAVGQSVEQLAALGAEICEVSMPHTEYALSAYYFIATAEASSNLARFDGVGFGYRAEGGKDIVEMYTKTRSEAFCDEVKRRIMLGTYALSSGYYDAYYLKALKMRTLVKQDFDRAFEKVDVLITPTTPAPAFRFGEKVDNPLSMYLQDVCTIPINLAGVPAISIPCGFADGLPMGLQIIGKALDEATVIRTAYTYEQNNDWHKRFAPLGEGK